MSYNLEKIARMPLDLDSVSMSFDRIRKNASRISDNKLIAEHYKRLNDIWNDVYGVSDLDLSLSPLVVDKFEKKAFLIANCFKNWSVDYYREQNVKDVKRVYRCNDKFCKNCQNRLSELRYNKFAPLLDDLSNKYSLYHVTFTVSNCSGPDLLSVLKKMYLKFPYFIRFFSGLKNVVGVDFKKYGFLGCIRSLEISYKQEFGKPMEYHPHFHCIFVFANHFRERREHINNFSFSKNSKEVYKYTDLEILIQKVWYLVYNDIRVTASSINSLTEGYSCKAIRIKHGDYKEVFKYTIKDMFKKVLDDFEVFYYLYFALFKRHIIQGYGCFYGIKFELESFDEEIDEAYVQIQIRLRLYEDSISLKMKLGDVLTDINSKDKPTYISRAGVRRQFMQERFGRKNKD